MNDLPSGNDLVIKYLKLLRENLSPDLQMATISFESFFVNGIFNSSNNDFTNILAVLGSIESPSSLNSESKFCIRADPSTVSDDTSFLVKTASIFDLDSLFPFILP